MDDEVSTVIEGKAARVWDYIQNNQLKVFAFIISSTGAIFVAMRDYSMQLIGFELWIISNMAWLITGVREEDYPLMLTFGVYFVFNMWAIANRIGWC